MDEEVKGTNNKYEITRNIESFWIYVSEWVIQKSKIYLKINGPGYQKRTKSYK